MVGQLLIILYWVNHKTHKSIIYSISNVEEYEFINLYLPNQYLKFAAQIYKHFDLCGNEAGPDFEIINVVALV